MDYTQRTGTDVSRGYRPEFILGPPHRADLWVGMVGQVSGCTNFDPLMAGNGDDGMWVPSLK
jgi:hypothetical protein